MRPDPHSKREKKQSEGVPERDTEGNTWFKEGVTGSLRKLRNENLHDLYCSSKCHKIYLIRKEVDRVCSTNVSCKDNTKTDIKATEWEDVNRIHLALNTNHWRALLNMECPSGCIKYDEERD